ncbi:hypothetical protein C1646_757403 [Rhizophagus diaphanus]|nr:hypothetical protein C1646_757403 [Rhizophagus diaphanus] [Rhizophagus sp. MUCL 43196]
MLESFLANKAAIISITSIDDNFTKLDLVDDKWRELQLFCDFLKPFFEFTEEMSDHLLEYITTIINNNTFEIPQWIKEIAEDMKTKFNPISTNLYNSTAYLVLVLDPRYKVTPARQLKEAQRASPNINKGEDLKPLISPVSSGSARQIPLA